MILTYPFFMLLLYFYSILYATIIIHNSLPVIKFGTIFSILLIEQYNYTQVLRNTLYITYYCNLI